MLCILTEKKIIWNSSIPFGYCLLDHEYMFESSFYICLPILFLLGSSFINVSIYIHFILCSFFKFATISNTFFCLPIAHGD